MGSIFGRILIMANISISAPIVGLTPTSLEQASTKSKSLRLSKEVAGGSERYLDTNIWLPQAAAFYNISKKLSDYVIIPVPVCITEMPNTNGDSISLSELLKFKPEFGQCTYKTWVGKPLFVEHQNKDYSKAVGVIFDSYLKPLTGFKGNHAKMIHLAGIDRVRNPRLAEAYLSQRENTFSMGMWYKSYICSICNKHVGAGINKPCGHTLPQRPTYLTVDNRLTYRRCMDAEGFELSCVVDPAFVSAIGGSPLALT